MQYVGDCWVGLLSNCDIKYTVYMCHLHTLVRVHMSYDCLQICITRQGDTAIVEAPFLGKGCGRVVYGAGRKAKRLVLQ